MRYSRIRLLFSVFVIVAATLLLNTAQASAQSTFTCGKWNRVSDSVGGTYPELYGVAGTSANDIWAVGYHTMAKIPYYTVPLIQHWNGTSWKTVKVSTPPGASYLYGVTAISSNDAWAVGVGENGALTYHWDGTQWNNIPNPDQTGPLLSVSAIASNDVWAIGYGNGTSLIEHWDGTQWSLVPNPVVGSGTSFFSVSADASNDVWAVGYYSQNSDEFALVEHWNGIQWSAINVPQPGSMYNSFSGVTAISPNDVWAVGEYDGVYTLTEHWDGTQWTVVSSPYPGNFGEAYAVAATSSTDIWAVGSGDESGSFTMQWDGTQWNIISDPYPKKYQGSLEAVTALPNTQGIWAVGWYNYSDNTSKVITEYYC